MSCFHIKIGTQIQINWLRLSPQLPLDLEPECIKTHLNIVLNDFYRERFGKNSWFKIEYSLAYFAFDTTDVSGR